MIDKNTKLKLTAVAAVAIIILASIIIVFESQKVENVEEKEEIFVVDDRINPYIYQGLTVEILRMRNRGLLERMFKIGNSWKNCPEFYYIAEVDGEIGDASTVEAAGGVTGSGTFTEWDTMGKECRINFKVPADEEGKKTSDVKITIMEIQKSGLLGRNENHIEKLSIDLVFDYRTGHWTGDDCLRDDDGYGHVLADEYELWFNIYGSDYDHDWIPFWMEANVYKTDPTAADGALDPDGDGIPSWWEWKYGYNPLTWDNHEKLDPDVDGIENTEEYMLEKYFADPYHPDVYIEVDFMEKNPNKLFDLEHTIFKEAEQMVIEKISEYGVSVYFDDGWDDGPINGGGEYVDFVETIDEIVGGHMARWYQHNFADERKGVFRYFQIVYNAGVNTASEFNNYDHVLMDSSPQKVFTRHFAYTHRQRAAMQAKGLLHELGHSMGIVPLLHYGVDNMPQGNSQWPDAITDKEWANINKNYESIMNYNYVFVSLAGISNAKKSRTLFDYSDGSHGEGDFNDKVNLYVATFQMDNAILESPDIRNVGFSEFEWTDKNPDPVYSGWEVDENLTEEFEQELSELRFDIDNAIEYNYRIYVKTDEDQEGRDVRIYTKPNIEPPTLWSLIAEGELDSEGDLEIYSYGDQVEQILELL
ncbi:MAG: hypothetical protein U9R21_09525 [Candidatus Thermoplasmatota archaeon]|nr:hypothetical protein [Candidatus Thermoplasmatota archaeon]